MKDYQREFLDVALAAGVLRFGNFTLKSGRTSPYFFNSGLFNTGTKLAELARFYVAAIEAAGLSFDVLYGAAYKGIPLVTAIALAFANEGREVPYAFNRKEIKGRGEGGLIIGGPLHGDVLIIDDVISAGTSVQESVRIIADAGARPVAVAVALDRQERGRGQRSASHEMETELGLKVIRIVDLDDLVSYLQERGELPTELEAIRDYRRTYGA